MELEIFWGTWRHWAGCGGCCPSVHPVHTGVGLRACPGTKIPAQALLLFQPIMLCPLPLEGVSLGLHSWFCAKGSVKHLCCTNPTLLISVEEAWANVPDPDPAGFLGCAWEISPSRLPVLGLCPFVSQHQILWQVLMAVSEESQAGAAVTFSGCWT